MPKQAKTDWNEIKQEYLACKEDSVQKFLRARKGQDVKKPLSGYELRKTKTWKAEKDEIRAKAIEITNKESEKENIENRVSILEKENLLKVNEAVVRAVANTLGKWNELSASDLKALWHIIRVERGLPTSVSNNSHQITGAGGGPIQVQSMNVDLSVYSMEELKLLKKLKQKADENQNSEKPEES
jgi:rRNA maturation endonuclease Nob1